jgi:two-component system chemotaxis response regulator CheY
MTDKKLKVLAVEDDALYQSIMGEMLAEHETLFAADVKSAIQSYKDFTPDVVFLDINLPDGSGYDVLKEIFAINKDAFVVMITGSNLQKDVKESLALGAKGYVVKPFSKVQVEACIAKYFILQT